MIGGCQMKWEVHACKGDTVSICVVIPADDCRKAIDEAEKYFAKLLPGCTINEVALIEE